MASRVRLSLIAGLCLGAGAPPAQVPLTGLPELARARAERLRPAQERAMQPFWADLTLDYPTNQEYLDRRIEQVAQLGDSVVPLLLEKLTPADGSASSHNLAANCARVLRHLDPASFTDALVELAYGQNDAARSEAIALLGYTRSPQVGEVLGDLLPRLSQQDKLRAIAALARLQSQAGAATVAGMLGSADRRVREEVLKYLEQARPPEVLPTVLQALRAEIDNRLLPRYVAYLGAVAQTDPEVASALLPLLEGQRLDWEDSRRLVAALAKIAPEGHGPTVEALHALLDRGDTGSFGLQAAVTLQALGDTSGMTKLHRTLNDLLRKHSNRKDANLYFQRGELYFAVEKWADALSDYESALGYSGSSPFATRCLLRMARCEARRHRWSMVLRRLKEANASYETVIEMSREDPAMQEALQQEKIRSWVNELPKERDGD